MAGLQKEEFLSTIQENLFESVAYLQNSTSHDAFVDNDVVNIPQAGGLPTVVKDRDVLPAPVSKRTDSNKSYTLSQYTTDAIVVQSLEELQTNYAKRESVLSDHRSALADEIAKDCLYNWAVATSADSSRIIRTSGATTGIAPDGTAASRKIMTKEDVAKIARQMDKDNMPMSERYLLLPVDMYYDLFDDAELLRKDFMNQAALPTGVIDRLFNFNIMLAPANLPLFDNTATPVIKAVGSAVAGSDNFAGLAWHRSAVCKAMGAIDVRLDADNPVYYGDVMTAEAMHGSTTMRSDKKGIISLVQSA